MFVTHFLDMEEKTPIISFRNADIINGEATVIYDFSMDVYPGDFIYIVGKVGTGKTSIIRTIIAENPLPLMVRAFFKVTPLYFLF